MRTMAEVVQERLDALQINPFEAARRAGLEKGFVNDLLIGRKASIRRASLEKLAHALECDPEYLTGHQYSPTKTGHDNTGLPGETASVPFAGIVEAGTWREVAVLPSDREDVPTGSDRRFPASAQSAFLVRGNSAAKLGVDDGSIVIGCAPDVFEDVSHRVRDGDPVIVRRWRQNRTEIELSVRTVSGPYLVSASDGISKVARNDPDTDVLAVVVRAIRVF